MWLWNGRSPCVQGRSLEASDYAYKRQFDIAFDVHIVTLFLKTLITADHERYTTMLNTRGLSISFPFYSWLSLPQTLLLRYASRHILPRIRASSSLPNILILLEGRDRPKSSCMDCIYEYLLIQAHCSLDTLVRTRKCNGPSREFAQCLAFTTCFSF